ncbi:unnamed protein product, partial [Amoebophrya sp. A25]
EERTTFDAKFGNLELQDLSNARRPQILGVKKDASASISSTANHANAFANANKPKNEA